MIVICEGGFWWVMTSAQRGFAGDCTTLPWRVGRGRVKGISCALSPGGIFDASTALAVRSEVVIGIEPSVTISME